MKYLKLFENFLKENSKYQVSPIVFISAFSQGVVEHGSIHIDIKGDDCNITIEQSSNGTERFFLDDTEYKEKLESFGIEFDGNEEIVGPEDFLSDLHDFYDANSRM
jgi:hypothetical protein